MSCESETRTPKLSTKPLIAGSLHGQGQNVYTRRDLTVRWMTTLAGGVEGSAPMLSESSVKLAGKPLLKMFQYGVVLFAKSMEILGSRGSCR